MYETLIVDGVDLSTIVTCIQSLDGLYQVGTPRGDNVVIPGVDGEVYVDKPYATGVVEFGVLLSGDTTTKFNDSFRTLKKLICPGKKLVLQRRVSYTTGNETHTADGEWVSGLNPSVAAMRFGRTTFGLKIHDGLWYATSTTTVVIPSGTQSMTVAGETRTHRMIVSMPAGGSITNMTTGHTLSNSATGATVNVHVEDMTAYQGFTDVSGTLTWTGRYPMRLAPGTNAFIGSGSTIIYTPAYL